MNILFRTLKKLFILPYSIFNLIFSRINKKRISVNGERVEYERFSSQKYLISFVVWVLIGYLVFKPLLRYNRIVYACPSNYSHSCSYVEAEFETICDKGGDCLRYYSKIVFSNKKVIKFSYCDMVGIAVYTCYDENSHEAWRLEYLGKNILKKE
jgi:hypothetical protein